MPDYADKIDAKIAKLYATKRQKVREAIRKCKHPFDALRTCRQETGGNKPFEHAIMPVVLCSKCGLAVSYSSRWIEVSWNERGEIPLLKSRHDVICKATAYYDYRDEHMLKVHEVDNVLGEPGGPRLYECEHYKEENDD